MSRSLSRSLSRSGIALLVCVATSPSALAGEPPGAAGGGKVDVQAPLSASLATSLSASLSKIAREIKDHGQTRGNLEELVAIGSRLGGSENAERAVKWAQKKLESYGFDRVYTQTVSVPRWTRGAVERATASSPTEKAPVSLRVAALGNSVGTGPAGVTAEVVEVQGLDEVARLGEAVRGKIVFYNRPMDRSQKDSFEAYRGAVDQRTRGPSQAAKFGAVATLVRSMTTLTDDPHPHTGGVFYLPDAPQIPAAALSTRDANRLSEMIKQLKTANGDPAKGAAVRVKLELSAQRGTPVDSENVIAEYKGRELPDEYVIVGGHLDSWDLGPGAHDDGAGVVQSIEVLRAYKALGLRPRRTVRVVLFMSEELGGVGGRAYAKNAKEQHEKHVAALESDRGGFAPRGFQVSENPRALQKALTWRSLLTPFHADEIVAGESGSDVQWLNEQGAATFDYIPDPTHYFDYHHAENDRLEAVDPRELADGAAAMAAFTFLAAEEGIP